jgi:hypothetical protein
MNKDIIDLQMDEDGTYTEKTKKGKKNNSLTKSKHFEENHGDEFLTGIDLGLDFVEKVVPRVERFLQLKK